MAPVNDNLANATVVTATTTLSGTTVNATTEPGLETDDGWTNTVWYRIEVSNTGSLILTLKDASFNYYAELYVFPGGGTPTDFADLVDGYSNYITFIGDGTPGTNTETIPVTAGDVYYLLVTDWTTTEGVWGTFTFNPFFLSSVCLSAATYISGSGSVSIVSGAVRETQQYSINRVTPYESFIGDLTPTLVFAGSDITNSPGYFAVKIKTKLDNNRNWYLGIKRNGMPLWPGTYIDSTSGSTVVDEWVTAPVPEVFLDTLQMLWKLPIHPDDTIEFCLATDFNASTFSIDVTEVCFFKLNNANQGPAFDILDVPDYPLGTSVGDLDTNAQQGDLVVGKDDAPTFTSHRIDGMDMCVTDDGTVWVLHMQRQGTFTGPVLSKWDGASWTTISDDIEGLGVKRANAGAFSGTGAPQSVSMDTDGTDLWIAYGVDDGLGPAGFRNVAIRVKKYDVGGASFSTLGSPVCGNTTRTYIRAEAGGFNSAAQIKVSPNGTPWLAFTDWMDEFTSNVNAVYSAKWNGSSWDVQRLPAPDFWASYPGGTWPSGPSDASHTFEAETYITGSPTVSTITEEGESAVADTQSASTNASIQIIPPAGNWAPSVRYQTKQTIAGGTMKVEYSKNGGTKATLFTVSGNLTTLSVWNDTGVFGPVFESFNGTTDTLEIFISRTGNVTQGVIDKVRLWDGTITSVARAGSFGPWYSIFVDDGQYHAQLSFCQLDGGMGENPSCIFQFSAVDPNSISAGESAFGNADRWQLFQYSEYNGSDWSKVWENIVEDDVPDHVEIKTRDDPTFYGYGHWQQGMTFATDGTDNYLSANLGIRISFVDQIVCLKIGPDGFVPFTDRPPGILGGPGSEGIAGGTGSGPWVWVTHSNSLVIDDRGNRWLGFELMGAAQVQGPIVANSVETGTGGWLCAAPDNFEIGGDVLNCPTPVLALSPDQTKLYILNDVNIHFTSPSKTTFGVWQCDIIQDAKIPLIIISGKAVRVYPDGRLEIINAPQKRVTINPAGEVTVQGDTESKRVSVAPSGVVTVLGA